MAKRYTEFCVSAAGYRRFVGDRRQVAGHRRVVVDCRQVAGQTHLAESSLAVDHNQIAGRKQVVMGLHQQLRRNQEKLPRRAAVPSWQSQRRGDAWHSSVPLSRSKTVYGIEKLDGFLLADDG